MQTINPVAPSRIVLAKDIADQQSLSRDDCDLPIAGIQDGMANCSCVRHTSQIIGRQVDHMTHLINDLLDVSRVTQGQVKLENASLDIRHIVSEAVEQVTPLMQSRRHHMALHLPPETAMVMVDK